MYGTICHCEWEKEIVHFWGRCPYIDKWRSPYSQFQSPLAIQTWWRKRKGRNEIQTLWKKLRYYVLILLRPSRMSCVWVLCNFIRTRKSGLFLREHKIKGVNLHSTTEFFFVYYSLIFKKNIKHFNTVIHCSHFKQKVRTTSFRIKDIRCFVQILYKTFWIVKAFL